MDKFKLVERLFINAINEIAMVNDRINYEDLAQEIVQKYNKSREIELRYQESYEVVTILEYKLATYFKVKKHKIRLNTNKERD